jgi:EAL domain-containing protein (putative c-di-GMP-specific phosphodiesterase class I)
VQQQNPDITIIVLSDSTTPMQLPEWLTLGVVQYLNQPVLPERLIEAVGRAARSCRMRTFRRHATAIMNEASGNDLTDLQSRFARALDRVWVAPQPILRARNGAVFGYEALLQCNSEDFPSPDLLFGAATRLGEVTRLGRVIRSRVAQALAADSVSVLFLDAHPLDLVDPDLHDYRQEITRLAHRVVLQFSENEPLQDIGSARPMLASLRDRGFRMALVEAGSGIFGPTNFSILDPEFIKIDPRLIRGLETSSEKRELVGSMAAYFRTLGVSLIAGGVRTPWERRCATELGCDLLQCDFLLPEAQREPILQRLG